MDEADRSPTSSRIRIDLISDVVCPWCVIGFRQLETALHQVGQRAEVMWHPFELNPGMAPEGENLGEHLARKYGTSAEESRDARNRLTAIGAALGFRFDYAEDMRVYNTFRAHQLLHWAAMSGHQHALKLDLFETFFTNRQNVDDPAVLADSAARVGLDRDEALAVLADGRYAEPVREETEAWRARGIEGVPAVIFNKRHLASGARGTENFVTILRQLAAEGGTS
ncbi:MAG: DsbA family oxidoreductase [Pseudomonadota bacterium]